MEQQSTPNLPEADSPLTARPYKARKPNPPSADSPLPAWQHYEITRMADTAIQRKLPFVKKEFLIGLEVQYSVSKEEGGEEISYALPFGKVVPTLRGDQRRTSALSPRFLDKIYDQVDTYVRENVLQSYVVNHVLLQVRTNYALYILSCGCRTIGTYYLGKPVKCGHSPKHSGKRWCCLSSGVWRCQGGAC